MIKSNPHSQPMDCDLSCFMSMCENATGLLPACNNTIDETWGVPSFHLGETWESDTNLVQIDWLNLFVGRDLRSSNLSPGIPAVPSPYAGNGFAAVGNSSSGGGGQGYCDTETECAFQLLISAVRPGKGA